MKISQRYDALKFTAALNRGKCSQSDYVDVYQYFIGMHRASSEGEGRGKCNMDYTMRCCLGGCL